MRKGIRYQTWMEIEQLKEEGFQLLEYQYEQAPAEVEYRSNKDSDTGAAWKGKWGGKTGIVLNASLFIEEGFNRVYDKASGLGASYLVIETVELQDGTELIEQLETYMEDIVVSGIKIYIENGYCSRGVQITENAFSGISQLKNFTDLMNRKAKGGIFGICLNIGSAKIGRAHV